MTATKAEQKDISNSIDKIGKGVEKVLDDYKDLGEKYKSTKAQIDDYAKELKEIKEATDTRFVELSKNAMMGLTAQKKLSPEVKAMVDYIAGKSAATFGDPTTGGYMAPSEFIAEVIHKVYDSGGIMALANVKSVTGMIAEIPYEASEGSSHWVGETETRVKDGNGAYGLAKIPMNTLISTLPLSNDLLNASAMNIESEMINSLTAKLQRDLESAFAVGTGVKQPLGLFSDSSIESIASGASGGLTSDALYSMIAEVPTATYANARFVMSNKILYNGFAKLKDLEGRYLLQPSLGQGLPMTLLGYPVSLTAFAPSTLTNGNIVAIFGDVRSAYVIGQGQSMTMVRDAITGYDNNMTYIKFNSRVGGQTVMPSSVVSMEVNES